MRADVRAGAHHAPGAPGVPVAQPRSGAVVGMAYLSMVVLVVSLLPWRSDTYYSGGLDAVVAAKALLSVIALAFAAVHCPVSVAARLRAFTVLSTLVFVAAGLVGASVNGNLVASAVLAVRVLVMLGAVVFLVVGTERESLLNTFAAASASVGLFIVLTSLPGLLAGQRLRGTVLPVNPNQIAILLAPPALIVLHRILSGNRTAGAGAAFFALLALTWATGSRGGLAALLLALIVMVVRSPRWGVGTFTAVIFAVPLVVSGLFFSSAISDVAARGGAANVLTLSSRTIAWRAVIHGHYDFASLVFGSGLSTKTVSVTDTFWTSQVVDSTWVSVFIQAGLVGLGVLAVWCGGVLVKCWRLGGSQATICLALAAYSIVTSVVETGLLDTYVLFVVMLIPALLADLEREPTADPGSSPARPVSAAARL